MRPRLRTTASHVSRVPSRRFSISPPHHSPLYGATLNNLRIGAHTRVIFQGFTGRQATANAQESLAWGTNIVGGVTPGREGEHLGLPVLPTVRRAMEELRPDATGIYVPASRAAAAIEDALEAEIPLIVAVAEHIPLHDMLRIHAMLKTQDRSRLVGPNSPGIISAAYGERCRIGFQPLPCFSAGCVGIAAKSGTLSYEAVAATTRAGLGQSLCIGVGGDILPGTDLVEALQVLATDDNTKAIALIGEVGGDGELLAAQWIRDYHSRTPKAERKPIAALIAGKRAPRDRVMGHAGAFWLPGEPDAKQKIDALMAVGVTVVNHPAKLGEELQRALAKKAVHISDLAVDGEEIKGNGSSHDDFANTVLQQQQQQTRGFHTSARPTLTKSSQPLWYQQNRKLHLDRQASARLLRDNTLGRDLRFIKWPIRYLALGIDRATRSQCITVAMFSCNEDRFLPTNYQKIILPRSVNDMLQLDHEEWLSVLTALEDQLRLHPQEGGPTDYRAELTAILRDLATLFKTQEAKAINVEFYMSESPIDNSSTVGRRRMKRPSPFHVHDMRIELDNATSRSGGRLEAVHQVYGALENRDPGAREAERHGIVYHRLNPTDRRHNIGTLVNGAGLAMNTIDALHDVGSTLVSGGGHNSVNPGLAANFLDTGGLATSETIKKSFDIILQDDRVRVIFVNIFGGLTRGDMIAQGILLAFRESDIRVPVVVRIRGTLEKEGQAIIAESGLPLYAFDDFDEAAAKAIALANESENTKVV